MINPDFRLDCRAGVDIASIGSFRILKDFKPEAFVVLCPLKSCVSRL